MNGISAPGGTTTSMAALHDAVVATLRARFGEQIAQYGAYEPWKLFEAAPDPVIGLSALLFEVGDFFPLPDPDPWGRMALTCTLAVHCVLSIKVPLLQQALRQYAVELAALILPPLADDQGTRAQHWGLGGAVEDPVQIIGQRDESLSGLHGRDAWVVRWAQTVYFTDSVAIK